MNSIELNFESFYPLDSLELRQVKEDDQTIVIGLKSITSTCECPYCQVVSTHYHGTHQRTVQDLPILGKNVQLKVTTHEYQCLNSDCSVTTFSENFSHFLDARSRMTERCRSFICALALETSGEGCARICQQMGLNVSGDTVIRLLLRKFKEWDQLFTGDTIGIDDFAFKKGCTYGTLLVDATTHLPIELLMGRDGKALRDWLKQHPQIKVVTRDRATAYAKVFSEELPDVMQIADRFHLHQNLLMAVKKALNQSIPASIKIPHDPPCSSVESGLKKKTDSIEVDHFILNPKRYHLIQQIQGALAEGCSTREVARRLGIGRHTVAKYAAGDPKTLSEFGFQSGEIRRYLEACLVCFNQGLSKTETLHYLADQGCQVPKRTIYDFLSKIERVAQQQFVLHGHRRHQTTEISHRKGSKGGQADYVTRGAIFRFIWFNEPLELAHHDYLFQHYPLLYDIKLCVQSFRQIYTSGNMTLLYLFIESYLVSEITSFKSFAKGLSKDIDAVENSVASPLSNGFVEGVTNKLKMIKRTMYGRGSLQLLSAKLILKI